MLTLAATDRNGHGYLYEHKQLISISVLLEGIASAGAVTPNTSCRLTSRRASKQTRWPHGTLVKLLWRGRMTNMKIKKLGSIRKTTIHLLSLNPLDLKM